jgi:hypothetical protein
MCLSKTLKLLLCLVCFLGLSELSVAENSAEQEKAASSQSNQLTTVEPTAKESETADNKNLATTPTTSTPTTTTTTTTAVAEPTSATDANLEVLDFVLASKIEAREPHEVVESYPKTQDKAYAFARLRAQKHTQITFVWLCDGKERNRFTTQVHAAKKWRTFASTKIRPGQWKVQLLSGNQVLAERSFTVQ